MTERVGEIAMTFEQYCENHSAHPHCAGCGDCIYDPFCANIRPLWCVECYERIDKNMNPHFPRPWDGDGMVLFDYDGRFARGNLFEAFERVSRFGEGRIYLSPILQQPKGADRDQ